MPDTPPIPTLSDVARAAGVSTATVSRCLNGKDKIADATREKVMRVVEQLGYTPHFAARVMAAKRSYTIGAIVPTMENAIFARGLQAFQEAAHEKGYTLLVSSSAYRPELEAAQIRALVARGADGLLLIGHAREPAVYDLLKRRGIPMVLAWSHLEGEPHASVGFDNRAAMRMLADQVIAMGHRRVAYISGVVDGNDRAAGRLDGIRDSWQAAGLDDQDLAIMQTPYDIENGAAAFETMMQGTRQPTVVMCGNDVLAAGALSRALDLGYDVPGDVSITGFDDIELARYLRPSLTTVHVPHRDMGRAAAHQLIQQIEGDAPPVQRQLDVSLTMRQSLRKI